MNISREVTHVIRQSVFAIWSLWESGSRTPTDRKIKVLPSLMTTFQRDGSQVLGKDIPGLQNWQEPGINFNTQRDRENL